MHRWLPLLLLAACLPERPTPPPPAAKPVDLDALAALRGSTDGATLEAAAAAERSAAAPDVYAAGEGDPALVEMEGVKPESAGGAAPNTAGESAPGYSEAPGDDGKPWIDMDRVSAAIRRDHKRLATCWDGLGGGTVILRLEVDTRGGVGAELAPNSPARNPELARCLTSAIERVDMPRPKNGMVRFDYPIRF